MWSFAPASLSLSARLVDRPTSGGSGVSNPSITESTLAGSEPAPVRRNDLSPQRDRGGSAIHANASVHPVWGTTVLGSRQIQGAL